MGPALQVHTHTQTTRRPLRGAARFPSMCGTDGGGLYSPLYASGNREGNQPKLFNRNISPAAVLHTITVITLVFSSTTRSGGADCHLYTLMD